MTSALPLVAASRRGLTPWAPVLLLPVLPLLVRVTSGTSTPRSQAILAALGLVALAAACVGFLPGWLDRLGWGVRKEAEQLRPAWLAALFAAQLPFFLGRADSDATALVVFGVSCMLVSAMSFGAEFQQRTVSGLLSQPVDRRRLWGLKLTVLAGALLAQVLCFTLSSLLVGTSASGSLALTTFGLAAALMAWASTPGWTLASRALLPGMIFSVTVALLLVGGTAALSDWLASARLPGGWETTAGAALAGVAFVMTSAYLVAAHRIAKRLWLGLEAPDQPGGEGGGAFLALWGAFRPARRWRSPWFSLAGKELRLQSITLASLAALLVALLVRETLPYSGAARELATAFVVLFGGVTILLAGAAPIAEERCLGTLDSQVLLPVSRTAQWRLKFGLAAGLALVPVLGLAVAFRDLQSEPSLVVPIAALAYAFVLPLLASSGCASTLRAFLLGLGLAAVALVLLFVLTGLVVQIPNRMVADLFASAAREPETWLARAAELAPGDLGVLERRSANTSPLLWLAGALAAPSVPTLLLALFFAGRNFRAPSGAALRLGRQATACLAVLLVAYLATAAAYVARSRGQVTAMNLLRARATVDLERRLSPTEQELRDLVRGKSRGLDMSPFVSLLVRAPRPPAGQRFPGHPPEAPAPPGAPPVRWFSRLFQIPLTPEERSILIEHTHIPETLRDAFRREAAAAGQSVSAVGSGTPPGPWPERPSEGGFPVSEEYQQRVYGYIPLGLKPGLPADAPKPASDPTPALPVVPGPTSNPPPP